MRTVARTLMIQGTASAVGKSLLVTALCRIFHRDGLRVAPFKAQNLSLNSWVTADGLEIGRAQAVQAEAAGIEPLVEMNPILLKPEAGMRAQAVVMGKPLCSFEWREYRERRNEFIEVIERSLARLRQEYEVIVIEGAGSPAEINLNEYDIVNMHVARLADAPVLLVGDIDRGGVFAQLVGTMELLAPDDRERVAGFLINKFRGERSLLTPALDFLTNRYQIPVLGVVPFVDGLQIADEDSVGLESRSRRSAKSSAELDIAVIRLPLISNFDDFLPLERESGVRLRYVTNAQDVIHADLAVIPGSKSTISDLEWMRREGIAAAIVSRAVANRPVLGICAGCQMLGESIQDPHGVESNLAEVNGLGLLGIVTNFGSSKRTARVRAEIAGRSFLADKLDHVTIEGYEIHMGLTTRRGDASPCFTVVSRNGETVATPDGAISRGGAVVGTMLHGIFANEAMRAALLAGLWSMRGMIGRARDSGGWTQDSEYDRLAEIVRENTNLAAIRRIAGI